jgi:hypothetical protein
LAYLTEDPIAAGLNGPADGSAEGTADGVIGGISAGLSAPGGAVASAVNRYRRLTDWTAAQSLGPTSVSGVSLALGICAAAWFTAGTRPDNINGAIALAACYLAALGARELASQVTRRLTGSGVSQPGVSVAQQARATSRLDRAVRSGWLAVLGGRLSDCVIYAGLAVGAIAQGWTGIWPLAMAVLGLTAIRDTMTACSGLAFPEPVSSASVASAKSVSADSVSADSVSADSAPADSAPADSAPAGSAPADSAFADSARRDRAQAASARTGSSQASSDHVAADADATDADGTPLEPVRDHPVNRAIVAVLTMPPGGRILLIAVAAPVWGARASLLGLLDWGIIAVCFGIGSRTVARRRVRRPRRRLQRRVRRPQAELAAFAVALQPGRPPDPTEFQTMWSAGHPISVLRMELSPAPPAVGPDADPGLAESDVAGFRLAEPGLADSGLADSGVTHPRPAEPRAAEPRAAEPRAAGTRSAGTRSAVGGLADIGLAGFGLADGEAAETDFADDEFPDDEFPVGSFPVGSPADGWFTGNEPAGNGFTGPDGAGAEHAGKSFDGSGFANNGFAGNFTGNGLAGNGFADSADVGAADVGGAYVRSADVGSADVGGADGGSAVAASEFALSGRRDGAQADEGAGDDSAGDDSAGNDSAGNDSGAAGRLPVVLRCRDDGAIARWFGRLVRGQLMPLPPALLALAAVAELAHLGLRDLPGILIMAPAIVMLVAAPGSSHPHSGRFDWLVPAVLQGAQYIYIATLGFATGVPPGITFLLCAAIALRYADLGSGGSPALPARRRAAAAVPVLATGQAATGQAVPERGAGMGWEGRMLICGLGAAMGITMFAYVALAAYVAGLVGSKILATRAGLQEGDRW